MNGDPDDPRSRVQAVDVAVRVLTALGDAGGPQSLSALAERAELAPAKLHRYLASLIDAGMVERRGALGYDLGGAAARLGLAALGRLDVVNRAGDRLGELVRATGCTAMLSVWGTEGPTVVRWERAARPLVTMLGVGSVLPVLESATGRAFAAALPERVLDASLGTSRATRRALSDVRGRIGPDGVASADEDYVPGLRAIAAPVLDAGGSAAAVITLISTGGDVLDEAGPAWSALVALARELNAYAV